MVNSGRVYRVGDLRDIFKKKEEEMMVVTKTTFLDDDDEKSEEEERGDGTKIDNTRLFVKNLPFTSTEDEITTLFGDHGKVRSVHLPLDPDTKTGRGFGFVEYDNEQDAKVARDQLDGASFQGRVLRIEHAEAAQPQSNGTTGHGSSGASNGVVEWASMDGGDV